MITTKPIEEYFLQNKTTQRAQVSRRRRRTKKMLAPPTPKKEKKVVLTEEEKEAIRKLFYTEYPTLSHSKFCPIAYTRLGLKKMPKQSNMWNILNIQNVKPYTTNSNMEDEQDTHSHSSSSDSGYGDGSKRLNRKNEMVKRYEEYIRSKESPQPATSNDSRELNSSGEYEKRNRSEKFVQPNALSYPLSVVASQIVQLIASY
jgi:hypothetical protein